MNDESINAPVSLVATISLGRLRFTGQNFSLVDGDAYLTNLSKSHVRTTWLAPHF